MNIPAREASRLYIIDSDINYFSGATLLAILQGAVWWASHANRGDTHMSGAAVSELNRWIDMLEDTDNIDSTRLYEGQQAYFTDRYGQEDADFNVGEMSQADQYAHMEDLTATESYDLNYYFGRNNTSWQGTYAQISFIAEGTEYVFYASATQTPIVLDIDGDGKLEASNGDWLPGHKVSKDAKLVKFDMNCDGFAEMCEWVGPNDGLLIAGYEGGEMNATYLFGNEGGKYRDGFEKLSLLDKNNDKKITGDELATLSVWQDKNGNAKVDDGEIESVTSLGITEIKAAHKHRVSSYIQNGSRRTMWDWAPTTFMVKKQPK
jgi:hypothetical protein